MSLSKNGFKMLLVAIAIASGAAASQAQASGREVFIERGACRASEDAEFNQLAMQKVRLSASALQCGDLAALLGEVNQLRQVVIAEINRGKSETPRGYCYEKKTCKGGLVVKTIVERGSCSAADGKSWKEVAPGSGSCIDL